MYVHVPSDSFGKTSEKANGTLEIAEIPAPELCLLLKIYKLNKNCTT